MIFDSFGAAVLTAAFIVPGFIYGTLLKLFTIPEKREISDLLIGRFTFSCWNFALWSPMIIYIFSNQRIAIWRVAGSWFLIIFVSPIILGLIAGLILRAKAYQWIVNKIAKSHIYAPATAWDDVWPRLEPGWIGISLRDGETIYGRWDEQSAASWDPNHRDIYLSKVYEYAEGEPWIEVENSAGVLVNGDDIVLIQFWKDADFPSTP